MLPAAMRTVFLLLAAIPLAVAAGDLAVGAERAETCLGCHGVKGYRNTYPSYYVPKIGGQQAAYLEAALAAYGESRRAHPTMAAQAGRLSEEEIRDLAAFFAAQEPAVRQVGAVQRGDPRAGAERAEECIACHGERGDAPIAPDYPKLAGQHADYLAVTLKRYRSGEIRHDIMNSIAEGLSDREIVDLSAYFAAQEGDLHTVRRGRLSAAP